MARIGRIVLDPRKLRALLAAKGLSQSELARRMGAPQSEVARLCHVPANYNDLPDVGLTKLGKVCGALGLLSAEPLLRYLPDERDLPMDLRGRAEATPAAGSNRHPRGHSPAASQ